MNTPKVSVIIPVYNTAKYLDECMKSVLGQTFSDIEIILVDDGSTDGISPKMCDDYGTSDNRVRVIHKVNGGLMSAWIEGTKEALADYVCYVDSDDWVDTDMIETLYSHVTSQGRDHEIISSNYIVEKAGERRKETQGLIPGVYMDEQLDSVRKSLLGNETRPVTMSRCMKLISRKLVLDNLIYCNTAISMSEDVNITLPCLLDCKRLVIVKEGYFYHYRVVSSSIVHSYNSRLLSNLELTDKTFREIFKAKNIQSGEKQMDREYIIMLHLVMKNELRCPEKGVVKRVRDIFLREDVRQKICHTPVNISGTSNKLLYFCMRHPNPAVVLFTKAVIKAYDRKTN